MWTLYLANASASYTPATWKGSWEAGTGVTKKLSATKSGAVAYDYAQVTSGGSGQDAKCARFVSDALAGDALLTGTIGLGVGTEKTSGSMLTHCHIWVTQGDSDSVRGTLLADWDGHNAWGSYTTGGRVATGISLTDVEAQAGDRIVIELGFHTTAVPNVAGYIYSGNTGADIAEGDNSYSGGKAGWLRFDDIGEPLPAAANRLTQFLAEVAERDTAELRLSQFVVETVHPPVVETPVRVSQVVVDVARQHPSTARVTLLIVEILRVKPYYDCANVSPGPSICGPEVVLTWIEETQNVLTSPTGSTVARVVSDAQLNDPASYYLGKKEARVLEFGEISRQLSDVRGQWQAATMTWREAEVDRAVRALFAVPDRYPVANTIDVCRMIKEDEWRDQGPARLMFIGHRLRDEPLEDMSIEQEAGDQLARDLEVAGQELECPRRLFSANFTPGIPRELYDVPEPIIYGRLSDALSQETPPNMTATAPWAGFMDGIYPIHGWAPLDCDCDPPENVALSESGGGSIDAGDHPASLLFAIVTSVDAQGRESDPSTFNQRDIGTVPSVTVTGSGKQVTVDWDAPSAGDAPTLYRVYLGLSYFGVRYFQWAEVSGVTTSFTFDNAPNYTEWTLNDFTEVATGAEPVRYTVFSWYAAAARMPDGSWTALAPVSGYGSAGPYRRPARVEFTDVPAEATEIGVWKFGAGDQLRANPIGYFVVANAGSPLPAWIDDDWLGTNEVEITNPPRELGAIDLAPYYGGQELVAYDGAYWHRWFVAGHTCDAVTLYLNGTKLISDADWLWPGLSSYEDRFGNPYYRDFNGRRYCVVYGRGANADALAAGETIGSPAVAVTLRANVSGVEGIGDGTGVLLEDIFEQEIHWWANFGPLGDYQSGAWLPMPDWEPIASHCRLSTKSWRDASAAAAEAYGSTLIGAAYMRERATMRDWIARWRLSSDTRVGQNAAGQWMIAWHDADDVAIVTFTEIRHVQQGSVRFEPLHDEHWTVIPYQFGFDFVENTWQEGIVQDAAAEAAYGEQRPGPNFELTFVRSAAQAAFLMARVLVRHKDLPWRVTFETIDLCGTNVELGDVVGLTGSWGLAAAGWSAFPLWIEAIAVLPTDQRTRLAGRTHVAPHLLGSP